MDDLVERLRAVKWEPTDDAERMPDDPTLECVHVDMRPAEFQAMMTEAAAALEAAREDAERYRWLRSLDGACDAAACVQFNIGFDWIEQHGAELDAAIDQARGKEARNG